MVEPERNRGHGHTITSDHPVLMREHIFLFDCRQSFRGGVEPIHRHEHKKYSFPKTSFRKEAHIQTSWRSQYQHNQHVYLSHPDMYRLSFFEDIGGKLGERSGNAKHAGKNVDVKTEFINRLQEQYRPFFNKTEILAKRKIRQRVSYQQQAEKSYRYPKQRCEKITDTPLKR